MSFQPVLPLSGVVGWELLKRTEATQKAAFDRSPQINREVQYFKDNIANATSAEALASDRTLFKIALGAFGLEEEIDKRFFMRKILEEGSEDRSALALRLVDPKYREMAETFGYGNASGARVAQSDFAQKITDAYKERQFEVAVGNSDNALRVAMNFRREIAEYAQANNADDSAWFSVMGNTALREVFEKAYGLPTAFGSLDIDRQKDDLTTKTKAAFGDSSLAVFLDPENVEDMIRKYLVRTEAESGPNALTPGIAAVSLLQSAGTGLGGANLLLSNAVRL